jgi:hypothetical protein
MLKNVIISGWIVLVMGLFCLTVYGSPSVPVGARQMGMGEAFTGIADDGNAIFYNPAGISRIESYVLNAMHARLFDIGNEFFDFGGGQHCLSSIIPIPKVKNFAIGFGWEHLGIVDDAIDFSQDLLAFSNSYTLKNLSVGLNLKYFQMKTLLDKNEVGDASCMSIDTGLLIRPAFLPSPLKNRLQLGVMVSDIYGGKVTHVTGVKEQIFPTGYRIGVMYNLIKKEQQTWLIACDVDSDRIHFGSEYSPHPLLALRGGMQLDLHTDEQPTFSIGATTKYESDVFSAFFHGAYVHHPTLPGSFYASASFNLPQGSPIKIEDIKLVEMYPPLLHFYSTFNSKPQTVVIPHQNSFELMEAAVVLDCAGEVKFQGRGEPTLREVTKNMKLQAKDIVHLVDANSTIQLQQDGLTVRYVNPKMENSFKELTEEDAIGRIFLENKTNKPLQVKVFIGVQDLGKESPATEFVVLPPKAKVSMPLRQIVFNGNF